MPQIQSTTTLSHSKQVAQVILTLSHANGDHEPQLMISKKKQGSCYKAGSMQMQPYVQIEKKVTVCRSVSQHKRQVGLWN